MGHTRAAAAIGDELESAGIASDVVDAYDYAASIFATVVADGYLNLVARFPNVYRLIYERAERARGAGAGRRWISRFAAQNLRSLVEARRPSAVVCTHAFPCGVMAAYKQYVDPDLPVFGVITDFVVHPYWIYDRIDDYTVATPEMRDTLLERGIASDRVHVDGIPVDARFTARVDRTAVRRRLGLPVDQPLILVMGGGLGMGAIDMMIDALASVRTPITVVALLGTNARCAARIRARAQSLPFEVRIVEYVENVYDYMRASDVLLTKPGGLSTSEALAAELPMVLARPLPGQEERNAQYLVSRGAALAADEPLRIAELVELILRDAQLRDMLLEQMRRVARPAAAASLAGRIATQVGHAPGCERRAWNLPVRRTERWPSG